MNNVEDTEAPPEEERSSIVENLGQPPENENTTTEKITPEQSDIIYCFMNYTLNRSIFLALYIYFLIDTQDFLLTLLVIH